MLDESPRARAQGAEGFPLGRPVNIVIDSDDAKSLVLAKLVGCLVVVDATDGSSVHGIVADVLEDMLILTCGESSWARRFDMILEVEVV
ncbi:MAG: hypothetical protein JWL73_2888 [Actinomycetia bacterium]|nr:hypothetical protein [Actinomycetes bacterium]